MAHLSDRWVGIILRIVRGYYPDAELAVWGAYIDAPDGYESPDARLELVVIEPANPKGDDLVSIRSELERSDLTVGCDVRFFSDLTIREQEEVLDRGIRIGS
jgi:hypothetical protein